MRKYYTCPLKAAVMAKYHGVQLRDLHNRNVQIQNHYFNKYGEIRWSVECANGWQDDLPSPSRFHIHPDSLPIFEPREGDLCEWIGDGIKTCPDREQYKSEGWYHSFKRIIQRNNEPFYMPEVGNG